MYLYVLYIKASIKMAGQTTEHGFQPEVEIDMQNNYCTCGRESLTSTTCVADAIHYGCAPGNLILHRLFFFFRSFFFLMQRFYMN